MPVQTPRPRWLPVYTASAASLSWFALLLQLYLTIRLSLTNGTGALHGVWVYVAFFTILTNLLVALALTLPAIAPDSPPGRFFARPGTITGIAANIALVGISYSLLLRHVWDPQGLQKLADVLLHDAMPIVFLLYWWMRARGIALRYMQIAYWAIYPGLYFVYALLRGALSGFYAYPFIDVATLGYMRVLGNALGILVGFIVIAAILIALGRLGVRRMTAFN
jgi:hypothetical protein